ncbi:MAG TPA: hypothetical protein VGQ36_08050 [Thermoanaerobaculia bacterium]|jgi:hypothetical protein|nr:hypothetical protein [Thermoanaerobaculia bacterium]
MGFDATAAFAKTHRARTLLEELKRGRQDLVENGNFLRADVTRDGREVSARFRMLAPLPSYLPCIVGDIAHNLRSALDHLVTVAIERNGNNITSRTQFPVTSSMDQFNRVVSSQLAGASPQFIDFVERAQPYHSPDPTLHPLHAINRLDIADKHRQLLAAAMIPAFVEFEIEGPKRAFERAAIPDAVRFPLVDGVELFRFTLGYGYEVVRPGFRLALGFDFALVEEPPIHGQPIVQMLYGLLPAVEEHVLYAAEQQLS